jgi:hypothetical protein
MTLVSARPLVRVAAVQTDGGQYLPATWSTTARRLGTWSCYSVFVLALVYVSVMAAGLAVSGLGAPILDPYQAVMELLILLLAVALVVSFGALHAYAPVEKKVLSGSALMMVTLMAGITICVHFVVLTVGRQADATSLPGYDLLFSWTWPSMIYALDIAAWDFCLGVALLLAAPVLSGWPARGLMVSGVLCLGGLLGAVLGDMNVRYIGILGYAVVLPLVLVMVGRLFFSTPTAHESAHIALEDVS